MKEPFSSEILKYAEAEAARLLRKLTKEGAKAKTLTLAVDSGLGDQEITIDSAPRGPICAAAVRRPYCTRFIRFFRS